MSATWRQYRGPALLGGVLVVVLAAAALLSGAGPRGVLDPRAYDPDGAHALAVLLQQQGIHVQRTTDVPTTLRAADERTTVFVPLPSLLSDDELQALAGGRGRLVVTEADERALQAVSSGTEVVGTAEPRDRDPQCTNASAENAGRALVGGYSYRDTSGTSCYPAGRGASLLELDELTLLGDAEALTNRHLDEQGNAALGIGLLSRDPRVVWLVPSPTRTALGERPVRSPGDLLPHWLHLVRWQLLVVLVVAALWRGRRLGRVVLEQLPAVVRASETVEGHGRLSRAAGARDSAATALRESAGRALTRLAHGGAPAPDALVAMVSVRTGRDPAAVHALLYGPTPTDDASLVRLARELDALVRAALTREGASQ